MKIGINAYEANVPQRVGSNQYAYQVLVQLEQQAVDDDLTVFLPSPPLSDMPKQRKGWTYVVLPPGKFWSLWRLPIHLYMRKLSGKTLDVFLSLGHYAPRFCPFPSIVCIMDLAYLSFPTFFKKSDVWKLKSWTAYSVKNAKHIIAISEHTKKDIQKHYKKKETDITVAYPGFDEQTFIGSPKNMIKKLKVQEPYVVYVGTMQPRKNLVRLVKAFEQVVKNKQHKTLQLVLAGKIGWMSDELVKTVQHSPARYNIRMLGFVKEEEKLALFLRAQAAILIGLYEGFGIPALEAMSAKTLPVVSSSASLPEVVGEAGIFVDPYSVEDIARGIQEAVEYSPRQKESFMKNAENQIAKFSWEKTGLTILQTLHTIGGKA